MRTESALGRRAAAIAWILLSATIWLSVPGMGSLRMQAQEPTQANDRVALYVAVRAKKKSSHAITADQLDVSDAGTVIDRRDVQVTSAPTSQEAVVSVLFDSMSARSIKSSTLMALDLLPRLGGQAFKVGVWAIPSRLEVIQPYTASLSEAEHAIKRNQELNTAAKGTVVSGTGASGLSAYSDHWSTAVLTSADELVTEKHVTWTYASVLAIARQQKKRTGRQAILLFTEQQDLDKNPTERYRGLLESLKDSNTLLYVIDANAQDDAAREQMIIATAMGAQGTSNYYGSLAGMHSLSPNAATLGLPPLQYARMRDTIADIQMDALGESSNALAQLAQGSGGASAFTGDSTKKLGRALVEGLTDYTTLTYKLPADQIDGRFHPVLVRASAPGFLVTEQPGYFALKRVDAQPTGTTASHHTPAGTSLDTATTTKSVAGHPEARDVDTDPAKDSALVEAKALEVEAGLTIRTDLSLSPSQSEALLSEARKNALTYADKLPNFTCEETISRSVDSSGDGDWRVRDAILESLQFQDGQEKRSVLKVNGEKSSLAVDSLDGTRSSGEFGNLLKLIFEPSAQAELVWVKAEQRDREILQVFRFKVASDKSEFNLKDRSNTRLRAGIHGLLYLDPATRTVRRLFLQTDALPRDFDVRSSWLVMNYDYVPISGRDYLLPTHGEVGLIQGKHHMFLNALEFSSYHRFGSRSHVRYGTTGAAEHP